MMSGVRYLRRTNLNRMGSRPSRSASAANGAPSLPMSVALNRRALISSLISRASSLAVANGSVPATSILVSRPERGSSITTERISVSSSARAGSSGLDSNPQGSMIMPDPGFGNCRITRAGLTDRRGGALPPGYDRVNIDRKLRSFELR
jgi:hypothetical protein